MSPSEQMAYVWWSTSRGVSPVVTLGQEALGDRHTHGVADALSERAGRDLDSGRVAALGVAGGARAPLAERFEVGNREVEAGEVEQRVLQDAGVAAAEDEAVAVGPGGFVRVDAQYVAEERVAERRERHRGPRVPGVRLLDGVHRERADGVDGAAPDGAVDVAGRVGRCDFGCHRG